MPRRTRVPGAAWGLLVLLAVVGLGEYVGVRAWALSFTHDESLTYTSYVHDPFSSILLSRETDANNHPLNTLAMKLAADMFGTSEIALRWSSVVAFVIYVVALVVLLRRVERWSIRFLGLALAVANPYVLDFFSLARGYALALALVVASAVATFAFVERPRARTALAAVVCAALAVLANYATLDYYLAVLLVIVLALIVPARTERSLTPGRLAAALLPPTLGVAFLAVIPLFRLRSEGELYFGGTDGFWQDTVRSLISSTLYGHRWDALEITFVALVAMLVAGGAFAAAVALRRRNLPLHTTAFMLLAVAALVSIVQHWVFGSPFLIGRTALFLVPLFAIWLAFAADALARHPRFTTAATAAAVVVVGASCINVASAANLSYVLDWRYDATTEEVITELARAGTGDPENIDLGVSFLFQPTTNFYRETRFKSLRECFSDCLDARSQYYYVIGPDVATVRERGARLIRIYALTGGVLARDTEAG